MPVIQQDTARIFDLQNPTAKMSKSAESDAGVLWLLDEPSVSAKKIMRAVTDSEGSVRYDREKKPGVSNLLVIYAALTGRQIPAIEDEYAGRGYGDFKKGLAEVVVGEFGPVRARALELLDDKAELDRVLAANADRASEVADRTLADVYDKVGPAPPGVAAVAALRADSVVRRSMPYSGCDRETGRRAVHVIRVRSWHARGVQPEYGMPGCSSPRREQSLEPPRAPSSARYMICAAVSRSVAVALRRESEVARYGP